MNTWPAVLSLFERNTLRALPRILATPEGNVLGFLNTLVMVQNNVTEVVNGIVQPRFYQVYGDLIESKEIMEPLAITAGTGPICGFDWVDTTQQDVTITSEIGRAHV